MFERTFHFILSTPDGHEKIIFIAECEVYFAKIEANDVQGFGGGVKAVPSFRDCQLVCQSLDDCSHVTYFANSSMCYVKTSDAGIVEDLGADMAITGPRRCLVAEPYPARKCWSTIRNNFKGAAPA